MGPLNIPPLRLVPDSNTIIQVSNAAFVLRHFNSERAKYPSEILGKHDKQFGDTMSKLEETLKELNRLFDMECHYASVSAEHFDDHGVYTRQMAFVLGKFHTTSVRVLEQRKTPPVTIKKVQRALQMYGKSKFEVAKLKDELVNATNEAFPSRKAAQQLLASYKRRLIAIQRRNKPYAQQMLTVTSALPAHEALEILREALKKELEVNLDDERR